MTAHLIVTRHAAAVAFIHRHAPEFHGAPIVASATPDDVRDRIVAGNLPLSLAAEAREVVAIVFPGAAPRGDEWSLDAMEAAGATLRRYRVFPTDATHPRYHCTTCANSLGELCGA